jgi:hypothetical protein
MMSVTNTRSVAFRFGGLEFPRFGVSSVMVKRCGKSAPRGW